MPSPTAKFIEEFIREIDTIGFSQRISNLEITPQPNAILFKFRTTQPTVPVIEIFELARDMQGNLHFLPGMLVTVKFDFISAALGNFFTEHLGRINGLKQDKEFSYQITAGNGSKPQAVAIGTFKTGKRSAAFVIRDIMVFNDGDPGIFGASGQMAFAFGFYNENDDKVGNQYYHSSISSGELRSLPFGTTPAFRTNTAPDWMAVYVRGQEDDHFFTPFHEWMSAPEKLPSNTTHDENDDVVFADAFQYLALPNEWGTHRLGFSLDSGPWGIHYIVTGWVDVESEAPFVPPVITRSAQRLQTPWTPRPWATLNVIGQRAIVERPDGRRSVYGLGPNGVLARKLKSDDFQRSQNWEMIEAWGVEAVSIVATDDGDQIIAVSAGSVRQKLESVSVEETLSEWRDIGFGFQSHISAMPMPDGAIVILALGLDGTLRGMVLEHNTVQDEWTDLGHASVGHFVALPKRDCVEIFVLTPEGGIQTITWQPASKNGLLWRSLEGGNFTFIYVGEEQGSTHLIAVTHDRKVSLLSCENEVWLPSWISLGTLDSVDGLNEGEGKEHLKKEVFGQS